MLAVALGLGGLALNILLIRWGLQEERDRRQETLTQQVGVSRGEAALVQELAQLDRLFHVVCVPFMTSASYNCSSR